MKKKGKKQWLDNQLGQLCTKYLKSKVSKVPSITYGHTVTIINDTTDDGTVLKFGVIPHSSCLVCSMTNANLRFLKAALKYRLQAIQ